MPMHVWPSARQPSAMASMRSPPSLQVECIWKSPRKSRLRHDGRVARQRQRLLHRHLTEEVGAQLPQRRNLVRLPRSGDSRIDRRRSTRFHQLRDDARAGRADEGHLAQRAGGDEVANRQWQRDDGLRRALVTELRAFIRLQGGHVVEQPGGDHVHVGRRLVVLAGSPFSPAAAGSGVCSQVHTPRRHATARPVNIDISHTCAVQSVGIPLAHPMAVASNSTTVRSCCNGEQITAAPVDGRHCGGLQRRG